MIIRDLLGTKLVTQLNYGTVNGKELIKTKSYPHVKDDAPLTALMAVANAIASVQTPVLEEVRRIQEDLLTDDGQ